MNKYAVGIVKAVLPKKIYVALKSKFGCAAPVVHQEKELPEWEYLPDGWITELGKLRGWNEPSVAKTQLEKWESFLKNTSGTGTLGVSHEAKADAGVECTWTHNLIMTYGYVLTLAARQKNDLSILDWGGGIGHYYRFTEVLLPDIDFSYFCQEVPVLCEQGRALIPEATFYEVPGECFNRSYDLVMAGGAMWYAQDWKMMADKLAGSTAGYLYITRMIFVKDAESYVIIQRPWKHGYQMESQSWVLNITEFVNHLEGKGMKLIREFIFGSAPYIADVPEIGTFRGFLFKKSS